jgi:hypothetical protein
MGFPPAGMIFFPACYAFRACIPLLPVNLR